VRQRTTSSTKVMFPYCSSDTPFSFGSNTRCRLFPLLPQCQPPPPYPIAPDLARLTMYDIQLRLGEHFVGMMESLGLGTDEQESTTAAWALVSFSGYESRFSTGEWTRRRWGRTRRAEAMWGASRVKKVGLSDASGGSADASALVPPHPVDFF
jgi:hypothetical protein